ncbi:hypothetical protein J2R99_003286 [Rhodopseudomonas julia]|uniref:LPXTG cell wall anchor domain-containing protein n=1 Tax=Rhodopseudomonas julia TaxID=200617 RepID=A0ABU0CA59_9BRAD|nr:hypothetical protein [Rhodopseudomonas julia]
MGEMALLPSLTLMTLGGLIALAIVFVVYKMKSRRPR